MTQLTMGQRISARRKLLGLSQEALADKLNVSRQAVSKWESDGTIPEVDKLIALGSTFSVSVGWILGTESDPVPHPEEGFTETQLKMLEQIVSRSKAKKRRLIFAFSAAAAVGIAVISVMLWQVFDRVAALSAENELAKVQLQQLSQNDDSIQERIDDVSQLLQTQAQADKLLDDLALEAYLSNDQRTVTITLYLKPKLYQQSNTAYVSIKNPYSGYSEMLKCTWNGVHYTLRHTVDVQDGYQYAFLLVNEYGYKEEDLNALDPGFASYGVYATFHLQPDEKCLLPKEMGDRIENGIYTFNEPIHTPHLFTKTAVAYKDIVLKLKCKGEVIWERSYKDDFRAVMKGSALNCAGEGLLPQVAVELPELEDGDELDLILTAETVNGGSEVQGYSVVLDRTEYKSK